MILASIFGLLIGLGMIGQWMASYRSGQILELKSEPIRIGFHLAAEMVTAVTLIISSLGLIFQQTWANSLFLIAAGMLFYTAIVSPGYFAQKGQWIWLVIFAVVIILGLVSVSFVF
ncbi:MAG: hypothetical protein H6667_26175 [Ardenticatenaceae bacterium]|nr:hypothetical protein [Ardenticatenaceae bacterium]MCB9444277.1 hypothetical protein [Ardenticatenaceae bacterium]